MTEKVHVLNFMSDASPGRTVSGKGFERRARQIGTIAGRAVAALRQAQKQFNSQRGWDNLLRLAEDRTKKIRQAAPRRPREWREGENRYQQARQLAREVVRDYPLHVVVAAGVAGFLAGAVLRIRRTHRAR